MLNQRSPRVVEGGWRDAGEGQVGARSDYGNSTVRAAWIGPLRALQSQDAGGGDLQAGGLLPAYGALVRARIGERNWTGHPRLTTSRALRSTP